MATRTRFDTATRAGRPAPMNDWTNQKFGFLPTTTAAEQYENETNAYRKFHLWFCNTTASDATFSVYVVPSGGVVGDQYALRKDVPIAAKESTVDPVEIVIETGDMIFLSASAANAVSGWANIELLG